MLNMLANDRAAWQKRDRHTPAPTTVAPQTPCSAIFCALLMNTFLASTALAQDAYSTADSSTQGSTSTQSAQEVRPTDRQNPQQHEFDIVSDLLIVLDADGRSHTVQHTVASDGPSLVLRLPGSIVPHEVMFFGADREQQTKQYKRTPNLIKISSGGAFARYQHQYGVEVQQLSENEYVLTTPSVPSNISVEQYKLTHSGITWVFPNEYELISYTITDSTTGRWVVVDNTLTFHHVGNESVELSINYKRKADPASTIDLACNKVGFPSDECAEDKDQDGIPDYRDICAGKIGQPNNQFGCEKSQNMVLGDIEFAIGRTYLDVRARNLLDRVAYALLRKEGRYFEIGAHTDNEGAAKNNRALSQKRADAVRHYLMLRGIDPNSIRATGYGEQYPIRDNASKEGRRANRRVELVLLE